jgi:hypothetical protein
MLTFRRHHHDAESPAWAQGPACVEYRVSGLELRLIDLVELRARSARAGFDDVATLDAEIAEVRDELAGLGIDPQGLAPGSSSHLAA